MHRDLINVLCCPQCGGDLLWKVMKEIDDDVVEGEAICSACKTVYSVNDSIAYFMESKYLDERIWKRCDRANYKKMSSYEEREILNKKMYDLTNEEVLLRIAITEKSQKSDSSEIANLYEMFFDRCGMKKTLDYIFYLMNALVLKIKEDNPRVVLDFASGRGLLASELAHNIDKSLLIFSDINPLIIKKCRENIIIADKQNNISYFVFDMKKSPFKSGMVDCITTLFGMQNIPRTGNLLSEIYRICQKKYYAISSLCSDEKDRNYEYLRENGMLDVWIKDKMINEFYKVGFKRHTSLLSYSEIVQPPAKEIVESGYAVTKFPCETCKIEYSLDQYIKEL